MIGLLYLKTTNRVDTLFSITIMRVLPSSYPTLRFTSDLTQSTMTNILQKVLSVDSRPRN
jgi:hypothetical protein